MNQKKLYAEKQITAILKLLTKALRGLPGGYAQDFIPMETVIRIFGLDQED